MTRPSNLFPDRYEVLKLRTGSEICGMTRDTDRGIEITLPMICHLQVMPDKINTTATFYPYAPLSSDSTVIIPTDLIAHRNTMNKQFIPFYDEASAKWLGMVENENIPLIPKGSEGKHIKSLLDDRIKELLQMDLTEAELDMLDEDFADFESSLPPKDPKKIH